MNKNFKFISSLTLAGILAASSFSGIVSAATTTNTTATTSLGVYRKLVEGKAVVPYVVHDRNDRVTIKDIKDEYSKISKFNKSDKLPEDTTVVVTGDTFEADGTEYTVVVYGDVDSKGDVASADALRVLRIGTGTIKDATDVQKEAADVINDGKIDSADALRILKWYTKTEKKLVDPEPEQEEQGQIYTVHFVDTKFKSDVPDVKTNPAGKVITDNVPKIDDKTDTDGTAWKLKGWTADTSTNKLVNFDEEVITQDTTLYSVWQQKVKTTLKLHYDGENDSEKTEQPKVVEISDYYTGDTVELPKDAHHTSEGNSSIIYTHVGWYISADSTEKNTEPLTIYTIPMPEETTEVKPLTIDLYPAWDISVSTIGKITGQNISTVLEEIKTLHVSDKNYCANVEISSEASIDNTINIPDGVTVKFDKAVTVAENGCLTGNIEKAEEVTVVKVVSNNNATNATKGLNVSLNNENYDVVQIKDKLDKLNADIKIEESSETVLNLNGFDIKMQGGKSFENSGTLTVINSSNENDAVLSATNGIKNNGNLTIGEKSDETPKKNIIIRNYTTGSTEATITNGENATLTIESGKIENVSTSAAKAAVNNEKGGTLVVEGGVIDASSTAKTPALLNEGVATITGGEFNRSKNQTTKGQGYYVVVNHGELEITGGDFKANTDSATSALIENGYYTAKEGYGKEESNLTITGGSFTAGRYTIKNDYAGNATIYGGNYSAKAATSDADNGTETRSIFKTIGEMTLDFRNATKENTLINLGNSNSKTALVLVGDQKLTTSESSLNKMVENKITVYPFDSELVKLNDKAISEETNVEEALKQLIVVEKGKSEATNVKSEIIVHVEHEDAKVAGEQLMTLFKNYIAKEMQGASADKNIVKIILDTDVEITAGQDILTGYENTKENTTLDLHGKTLKIPALYIFNHDVHVEDSSADKSGKIVLNSALTENKETEIFKGGEFIPEEQLKAIADSERD